MDLKFPRWKRICWCLSLQTCGKIIGFAYTIVCLLAFILHLDSEIKYFTYYTNENSYHFQAHVDITSIGITLFLIFGLYLLVGVYAEKPSFIMAWLIFNWSSLLLILMQVLENVAILYTSKGPIFFEFPLLIVLPILAVFSIIINFIVHNVYEEIKSRKGRRDGRNYVRHNSITNE